MLKTSCFLFALCLLSGLPAVAQDGPLSVELLAHKAVVDEDTGTSWVEADTAAPGDLIRYTAIATNNGTEPTSQIQPVVPIPDGLDYVHGSANPRPDAVFVDNAWMPFGELEMRFAGGEVVDVRAVRWTIPMLAPATDASCMVSARVAQ